MPDRSVAPVARRSAICAGHFPVTLIPVNPMRILVAIAFILIIGSLASALVFLMKDKGRSNRTVKALAFRVGFSITLFVLLLVANQLGWIQPTGIR